MRLIDADNIRGAKFHDLPYTHIVPRDVESEFYMLGWNDAIDAIVEVEPTIDAVEVVRCRDCKHRSKSGLCNMWSVFGTVTTDDDMYCSYGERKDGDSE